MTKFVRSLLNESLLNRSSCQWQGSIQFPRQDAARDRDRSDCGRPLMGTRIQTPVYVSTQPKLDAFRIRSKLGVEDFGDGLHGQKILSKPSVVKWAQIVILERKNFKEECFDPNIYST